MTCRDPRTGVGYPSHEERILVGRNGQRVHMGTCGRCGARIPMPWDKPNREAGAR